MAKRIVILGPAHPLRGGGMTTFDETLAYKLQEQGREVEIWSYSLQYPDFLFPGKSQYTDDPQPEGLRIRSVINSVNPLNWIKVGRALYRHKPDIIFVRYWMSFFGPALGTILRLARRSETRICTLVDNIIPHEPRIIDRPFNAYFLPTSDDFVCMSQEVQKDLQKLTSKPIKYTPHPLYENYGDPVPQSDAKAELGLPDDQVCIFLFFGFIRKYKGLDLLLQSMIELQSQGKRCRLLIAGEYYDDPSNYASLLQQLGPDTVVQHTDFIPNDSVKYYFCAADYLVLPYYSATQSGVSQVALYYDLPIVCTDVGGLPEFVEDERTGFICEPTVTSLSEALSEALEYDRQDFTQEISVFKQRFSWETFIKNIDL